MSPPKNTLIDNVTSKLYFHMSAKLAGLDLYGEMIVYISTGIADFLTNGFVDLLPLQANAGIVSSIGHSNFLISSAIYHSSIIIH
jgi:hypothetical protein